MPWLSPPTAERPEAPTLGDGPDSHGRRRGLFGEGSFAYSSEGHVTPAPGCPRNVRAPINARRPRATPLELVSPAERRIPITGATQLVPRILRQIRPSAADG